MTDIGVVTGLIRYIGVVSIGIDIAVLLTDPCKELLCRVPNGGEFLIVKGRLTFRCLFDESVIGFFGITVFLDDTTRKARHCGVSATFGNDGGHTVSGHIRIEVLLEKLGKVDASFVKLHLRVGCAEEEPCCIQGVGVEIREHRIDELFHIAVCNGIGHMVDGKENVELGASCLAVFLTHIGTAVVNGKGDTGECFKDICGHYPIVRILGVVIVAIYGQAIRPYEVFAVTVVVAVFGAHIVVGNRRLERFKVGYGVLMGIRAVAGVARIIGAIYRKH